MDRKLKQLISLAVALATLLALVVMAVGGLEPASAAGQAQEKIVVSISNNDTGTDYSLYTLNPDGTGQTKIFDFSGHPKDPQAAIWQPRIAPGGGTIHFVSDNAYLFTGAGRNLFRIASDGSWWDQITPTSNSGKWGEPCPCGIVQGTVKKSNGDPWSGAPVYLEGMDAIYTEADGSFRIENVPEGRRMITACEPGDCNTMDTEEVLVSSAAPWTSNLVPGSNDWLEFQWPILSPAGDRIYHTLGINQLQWTGINATAYTQVYAVGGTCFVPDLDGYDVAPSSGKLAIMDYGDGCPTNRGLYTADKDGGNVQLLIDMKSNPGWCGGQEVFWSPDESKVAIKACYDWGSGWQTNLFTHDAATGNWIDGIIFPASYSMFNVAFHGWSPDGGWLLYSYWSNDATKTTLTKVKVNADGTFDVGTYQDLLTDTYLGGATWGNLEPPACTAPLTGVTISGPSGGTLNKQYTFTAGPEPANATSPTYTWSTGGLVSGQGTASAKYSWSTVGEKTVSVTATNCGGTATVNDSKKITIGDKHSVYLPMIVR